MVPVPQERVPAGDLAHFVSDLVKTGALDLSAIYASYEEKRGYKPAWSAPFPSLPIFLAHNCARRTRPAQRLRRTVLTPEKATRHKAMSYERMTTKETEPEAEITALRENVDALRMAGTTADRARIFDFTRSCETVHRLRRLHTGLSRPT